MKALPKTPPWVDVTVLPRAEFERTHELAPRVIDLAYKRGIVEKSRYHADHYFISPGRSPDDLRALNAEVLLGGGPRWVYFPSWPWGKL